MAMSYADLLARGEWQERRLEIMKRDNFMCQAAGCTDRKAFLNVHHLDYFYDLKPWEYPDDLLITLCDKCHKIEDRRTMVQESLFTALKQKGFLVGDLLALTTSLYSFPSFTEYLLNNLRKLQNG